ncbi:hypothetical protein M422DRAFT_238537 [Sphaerobolus stellatus SS14]|nr:hypothetical protein M422DRAFT_238537 [Sphaerobolus stellatus SS14]
MTLLPGHGEATTWLNHTTTPQDEQKHGKYNWLHLFKDSQSSSGLPMNVADFVGPIVVAPLPNRGGGRGIITTRYIGQGELLMVAKPFVASFPGDFSSNEIIVAWDMVTKRANTGCDIGVIHKNIEKLYRNPDMRDFVSHL